jgi:hypothetical protein
VRPRWLLLPVAGLVIWSAAAHPWGWLYGLGVHPYPASSSTPWTYQLWSGFIPALTVTGLLASAIGLYRHANCHVTRCFRLARYPVAGGQFKVCAKHHPDEQVRAGKVSHEHILRLHREHRDRVAP